MTSEVRSENIRFLWIFFQNSVWVAFTQSVAMQPLATNHRVLRWLCLYPTDENTSKWQKLCYILFAIKTFLSLILILASCIVYFCTFVRTDMEKSLSSLFQIAGFTGVIYELIAMFFLRYKITSISMKLSAIYKASENRCGFYWKCLWFFLHCGFYWISSFNFTWIFSFRIKMQMMIRSDFWPMQITTANLCGNRTLNSAWSECRSQCFHWDSDPLFSVGYSLESLTQTISLIPINWCKWDVFL